jgi:type IV pilus assembly protein PilC
MPLTKSTLLPRSVVQMIGAGEESGKLGEVLDQVSEFYAKELKTVIKSVTAMIEPLMIVLMGGIVGFIAMSIILPIFKLSQLVK